MVGDWLLHLPVLWMVLVVFAATYFIAGGVYLVVTRLAVNERAKAFKAVSPGMLPPLGILFGLLGSGTMARRNRRLTISAHAPVLSGPCPSGASICFSSYTLPA